jgi:8-oxo-dGTP pyrophosphatase MutT (NUDIX family)
MKRATSTEWTSPDGVRVRFTFFDAEDGETAESFHPATQSYGICFDEHGDIFIGRFVPKLVWNIPGGTIEPGEAPLATLHREVDEELSLELTNVALIGAQYVEYLDGVRESHWQLRYVALARAKPLTIDPDKGVLWERRTVRPDEFLAFVPWGSIGEHMIQRALAIREAWLKN